MRIRAFVGFTNVSFEMEESLDLALGTLRRYESAQLELLPPTARPPVRGDTGEVLGFILESDYDFAIRAESWAPGDQVPDISIDPTRFHRALDLKCESIALSFALAFDRDPPVGAVRTWTMLIDPLSHGGISWRESRPPVPPYRMVESDKPRVGEWTARLNSVDDRPIAIARRRLLSALTERLDPVDGFIDAVITWENMFGSRQGESTLRISSAMASLLESDVQRRLELSKEIADLYGSRSAVLHGGTEPSLAQASEYRDRSLNLATKSMKRMYVDFPNLLTDKDRARILILSL
jgi:hypothetical protein